MRVFMGTMAVAAVLAGVAPAGAQEPPVFEGPVPRADCGPGSRPESPGSLQGEVTVADRESGRSLEGYTCNLHIVGNAPGEGGSWQHTWSDHCAYYDSRLASGIGTYVVDASEPAQPKETRRLTSTAMLDPWESLSVAENRKDGKKLLAGVYVNSGQGGAFMDIYDVTKDCANPRMLFSGPVSGINHEGNWSMDGMTYYSTGIAPGVVTAVDVENPEAPTPITTWFASPVIHGLSTSDDGNRLYLADITGQSGQGNGLSIWDTSGVQARTRGAQPPLVGSVGWSDGSTAQHTIPITVKGKPMVVFVDEGGYGMARIIDIADESKPKVISKLKLEIDMPANEDRAAESAAMSGLFGYNAHYCGVDSRVDPTVLGCSYFASGIRIFDIRDPYHPKEIAYLNVGGTGQASPPGSQEDVQKSTSSYASARVRFIKERGEIWFTDQNKGFFAARFTNGVWPFEETGPQQATVGLPAAKGCLKSASVRIRVQAPKGGRARSAVVYVNGRRVKRVRGRALRRRVSVKLPAGRHSKVRIVVTTTSGKRYTQTRGYTRCAA